MVSLIKYLSFGFWLVLFIVCFTYCESTSTEIEANYTGQNGTVIDVDNNIYQTIGIGSQIWMAENLETLRLNDGTEISNIINDSIWTSNLKPAYCTYSNDTLNYKKIFGLLYNYSLDVIITNSSLTLSKNKIKRKSALSIRCIKK